MANIDIYKQYFEADCVYNNVERKGVVVWLNAESECGTIRYEVGVSFFPHRDKEDFGRNGTLRLGNSGLAECKIGIFLRRNEFH